MCIEEKKRLLGLIGELELSLKSDTYNCVAPGCTSPSLRLWSEYQKFRHHALFDLEVKLPQDSDKIEDIISALEWFDFDINITDAPSKSIGELLTHIKKIRNNINSSVKA